MIVVHLNLRAQKNRICNWNEFKNKTKNLTEKCKLAHTCQAGRNTAKYFTLQEGKPDCIPTNTFPFKVVITNISVYS